ncbi:hypothetical protein [Corynebacterium liangguodongii]|uniref:Uncharacterized protein n=1 Tax=Corynebacterium liangguodongii TaxID=2079535 RepID=A0A2S0WBL1_9CORY|nr:hypothetical protein [Corynebacterium liangguodongii]AWB83158.1 hypothetical protein C3E79_00540 [Corynebacterium liangguodongii]PWB98752.1 hypothetical protein DF219_10000 [Corynebacterium liangguodongii]
MPLAEHRAPVIDLALVRPRAGTRSTYVVRASARGSEEDAYRYIGIDEAATLADVSRALALSFGFHGCPAPSGFSERPGAPTELAQPDGETTLGEALSGARTTIFYHWGLWQFELELVEAYPRDDNTPPAVVVAGAGDFAGAEFRIDEINRELIGDDSARAVLAQARPEVRDIVERSGMYDYVLLLKAVDLGRVEGASISEVPRERTPLGRDAFYTVVLALACLADAETTDTVIEATFAALGHTGYRARDVRELCAGSLVRLAALGAYGAGAHAPVARLDVYRALLRG